MRRKYQEEIAELAATYAVSRQALLPSLAGLLAEVVNRSAVFVGSGGALALAQFAAALHQRFTGRWAMGLTPLEFNAARFSDPVAMVLLSSGGKNSDARMALASALEAGCWPVGLISRRSREELGDSLSPEVKVATVPSTPDGFLATNSVLATAVQLVQFYQRDQLPAELPLLGREDWPAVSERCLVLYPPGLQPVATDLETRMSETGLSAVQLTDYRNLAHGRHVGLTRNLESTTIVAFVSEEYERLAERTLQLLPPEARVHVMRSEHLFPIACLDLLPASIQLVSATAKSAELDPGQPGVRDFGRKLYHLSTRKLIPRRGPDPVDRKLAGLGRFDPETRATLQSWLDKWIESARSVRLLGLVLDYDGTCCTTEGRFDPVSDDVRASLIRLLDAGFKLGLASGRGSSLHTSLREALPEQYWSSVALGFYNGTQLLQLSDQLGNYHDCVGPLAEVADRLEELDVGTELKVERRTSQVTVESSGPLKMSGSSLHSLVSAVIKRHPPIECKVVASAHSVDVLPVGATKASVVEEIRRTAESEVMAIGDQGHPGGNDFELLAATELSLSVDTCSPDPSRCWNLDVSGKRGPDVLVRYLDAIQIRSHGAFFDWHANAG